MSFSNRTAEEVYQIGSDYWNRLNELFGKSDSRGPPALLAFRSYSDPMQLYNSLQIYPQGHFGHVEDFYKIILAQAIIFHFGRPFYASNFHIIGMNLDDSRGNEVLAEETTHSVMRVPNDRLLLTKDDLDSFSAFPYRKGFIEVMTRFGVKSFVTDANEFYVPIGQAHVTGSYEQVDFEDGLNRLNSRKPDPDSVENVKMSLGIIPQFAGQLLVDLYKKDAKELIRTNPELKEIDGQQLWREYALPLLRSER